MFTYEKPEAMGVKSENIRKYVEILDDAELSTHNIIIAKGDKIIYENYYAPFNKNFLHRMYSVTKSFVAIAVGFLVQEGKISLDDKIVDLFPKDITNGANDNMKKQTVRNMLMMSTGFPAENGNWFIRRAKDRVKDYFSNSEGYSKIPGSFFEYDSHGSFVLGAMVERISGMELTEYLRSRLFDKIGVSKEAYCLKCPGGYAWGDSALMCTATDLLKVAKFTMNLGNWEGEQILSSEYLTDATSNLIPTHWNSERPSQYGYGYLIWKQQQDSFFFNGMGCQFAVCFPKEKLLLITHGYEQLMTIAKPLITSAFIRNVLPCVGEAVPEVEKDVNELCEYTKNLKLARPRGKKENLKASEFGGRTYKFEENELGFKWLRFDFSENGGKLTYENDGGECELAFSCTGQAEGEFPAPAPHGKRIGTPYGKGYRSFTSAAWSERTCDGNFSDTLSVWSQVYDMYKAQIRMTFAFGEDSVTVIMASHAEWFYENYSGFATGIAE